MIELRNIYVTFSKGTPLEHRVFEGIDLKIDSQQFVTVIGGNGAGKSTLMNVISGDIIPDKGQILLAGNDVTHWRSEQRASLISRVFQDPLLGTYADLTIEENLALAYSRGQKRSLRPALNTKLRKYFQNILGSIGIGLEHRLRDNMGLLSGGQRQAVSLLMATLQPSKILLLDEHTAALDPKMESMVVDLTRQLIEKNQLTALMITHCMQQALELGNRTLVMHQGKIVRDLTGSLRLQLEPSELFHYY